MLHFNFKGIYVRDCTPLDSLEAGIRKSLKPWTAGQTLAVTVQVIKLSSSRGDVDIPTYHFSWSVVLEINFHMNLPSLTAAANFIFILALPPVKMINKS